jgi:phosphatidylglycerophosphatase A
VFFLRPTSIRGLFSLHPLTDAVFSDTHFLVPGSDLHNSALGLPLVCALGLLVILGAIGVWSSFRAAEFSGIKDPQFVVIDEVAGQHLTLLLPLIPIALPHLTEHMDFSAYAIFFTLSLVNWKYLLLGFVLFRVFDIWKPFPVRQLEKLPHGWGIMADDWMAGIYAAILLRVALHLGLLGWVLNSALGLRQKKTASPALIESRLRLPFPAARSSFTAADSFRGLTRDPWCVLATWKLGWRWPVKTV